MTAWSSFCFVCRQLDSSYHASVFSRDENGRTGLHYAARLGTHTSHPHTLPTRHTPMHTSHPVTLTLHTPHPTGNTELVSVLLSYKALLSATDHHSSTPLHLACQKGHQKCTVRECQLWLSVHACMHMYQLCGCDGRCVCVCVCVCVQLLLLGEGASVNATDNHGNTPLHLACSNGHGEVSACGCVWYVL